MPQPMEEADRLLRLLAMHQEGLERMGKGCFCARDPAGRHADTITYTATCLGTGSLAWARGSEPMGWKNPTLGKWRCSHQGERASKV